MLPVTEIASSTVKLAVGGAAAPPPAAGDKDWTRWNDHGIALLRGRDPKGAEAAFAEVDRLWPKLPDGPRNLARAKIAQGQYDAALELLGKAEDRAPDDPRNAFWFGRALVRTGKFDLAQQALERSLKDFPEDRNSMEELANMEFQRGNLEASLGWWLRVLQIDPENANAHYHRHLCYVRMGRDADAEEARKSYERYKTDENAPQVTNAYLREHPDVNREAQGVHVHELEPAR